MPKLANLILRRLITRRQKSYDSVAWTGVKNIAEYDMNIGEGIYEVKEKVIWRKPLFRQQ